MESVRVQAHNHEVRLLERRIATKMEATDFLRRQVDLIANGGDR